MAHVHGVLWIDKNDESSIKNSDGCSNMTDEELVEFIDKYVTCELPEEDNEMHDKVKEVQTHHHTKTCRKYDTTCRFNYPKWPSLRTIIAKPIADDFSDEERKEMKKKS